MNTIKRHVLGVGRKGGQRIALPKDWCETQGIKNREVLDIVVSGGNGGILILPKTAMSTEEMNKMFNELTVLTESIMRQRGKP